MPRSVDIPGISGIPEMPAFFLRGRGEALDLGREMVVQYWEEWRVKKLWTGKKIEKKLMWLEFLLLSVFNHLIEFF